MKRRTMAENYDACAAMRGDRRPHMNRAEAEAFAHQALMMGAHCLAAADDEDAAGMAAAAGKSRRNAAAWAWIAWHITEET